MRSTPLKRRRERELLILNDFLCLWDGVRKKKGSG
jgi:hypothetical protein